MSYEIRNDKLLREAYEAGRRDALNEQAEMGGPPAAAPARFGSGQFGGTQAPSGGEGGGKGGVAADRKPIHHPFYFPGAKHGEMREHCTAPGECQWYKWTCLTTGNCTWFRAPQYEPPVTGV